MKFGEIDFATFFSNLPGFSMDSLLKKSRKKTAWKWFMVYIGAFGKFGSLKESVKNAFLVVSFALSSLSTKRKVVKDN